MMGLSSLGCGGGGGNLSTSNLSASAPPFTVDRLNPKPNSSNPLLHYSESPYVVSHPSQYAHFSAPRTDPALDLNEIMSVPAPDNYQFSASASVSPSSAQWSAHNSAYGDVKQPYYNPYVPPLVGEESKLAGDDGSRYSAVLASELGAKPQQDYTPSSFELAYGRHWIDSLGLDDDKGAKRSELDLILFPEKQYFGGSHGYENQPYRGGRGSEKWSNIKEHAGVLHKNPNHVSEREVYTGSSRTGYMKDKSCLDQQLGFFHGESSRNVLSASGSPYPESYPSVISCAMQKDFPIYQNSHSPYERCVRPIDASFPGQVSVTRSSPTVVIRPPPATNTNLGQGAASHKPAGVHVVNSVSIDPSKPSDSSLKSNLKSKDDFFETSLIKSSKQENTPVSTISVSNLRSKDNADCQMKAALESQVPDVNLSSGFTLTGSNIQVVSSTGESSEIIDYQSTAVDSPCWRGAPSSQLSMFDIEAGNSDNVGIHMDEHYGFNHGEHQSLLPKIDSDRFFSEKVECGMGNENQCGKTGETLCLEKSLDAICSTAEEISLNDTIDGVWVPPSTRSKGVELSFGPTMMKKENFPNNVSSVFDEKVSDTNHLFGEDGAGTTEHVVSEDAAVAIHAAENVLASPASQEDEQTAVPDSGLDVAVIVKTIDSLVKLLRIYFSSDVCSLGEENTEILKHAISSLNVCLTKKGIQARAANKEPKHLSGETSEILEAVESSSMGILSGGSDTKCEPSSSCTKPDYLHFPKRESISIFPGKKDEMSSIISPLRDDLHMTGDDDMTQAIKKVLEQNFHIKEEDMDPQALLFKSLWLESEAKLCSISYKARFERMKIQMEEIKLKALKDEDIAEMTSEHEMSPDLITESELPAKACGATSPKLTSSNSSNSDLTRPADNIEPSVLSRFNILKSREEYSKPINTEERQQPAVVADSIMERFNILKSREGSSKEISMNEGTLPQVVNDEKYFRLCIGDQLEDFQHAGFEAPKEYGIPAGVDPAIHLFKSGSRTINENNSGLGDSSSSEWEHVLKEDFSWKNC